MGNLEERWTAAPLGPREEPFWMALPVTSSQYALFDPRATRDTSTCIRWIGCARPHRQPPDQPVARVSWSGNAFCRG
jgi:hypothetical protein